MRRNVLSFLDSASAWLAHVGLIVAGAAVVGMMVLVSVEVATRNLLDFATQLAVEFSGYFLVVVTFLGAAYALRTETFVRVSAFYQKTRSWPRDVLDLIIALLGLAYTSLVTFHAWEFTMRSYRFGSKSIEFTETPLWIPQLFVAVGTGILAIELFRFAVGAGMRLIHGQWGKQ